MMPPSIALQQRLLHVLPAVGERLIEAYAEAAAADTRDAAPPNATAPDATVPDAAVPDVKPRRRSRTDDAARAKALLTHLEAVIKLLAAAEAAIDRAGDAAAPAPTGPAGPADLQDTDVPMETRDRDFRAVMGAARAVLRQFEERS